MRYLSTNQAVDWLKQNATFANPDLVINKKFMKKLDDTCRLLPDKVTFFKKYYSIKHLRQYAKDVKPR